MLHAQAFILLISCPKTSAEHLNSLSFDKGFKLLPAAAKR